MIRALYLLPVLLIFTSSLIAQSLPTIRATSTLVSIKDGDVFHKGSWTITPQTKPDVYTVARSSKHKKVTFYTDIDSITVDVKPGSYAAFNILLNDKDTALTGVLSYDTLATLKRAGKYNLAEKNDLPAFTYQSADDPHLQEIRKTYKLDSIAGQGNEVSKFINIMHWVHNQVPHDGGKGNPPGRNALDMITVCNNEKRGLNCRGLAIVLNECYLAMGFPSRFVTCLPKDSLLIDGDCHVIDMVYSKELKKWLWMDPTFDAYVMNEKGELLGIGEVRERIINGRPLILNPDANWNRKVSQDKVNYLYSYMAKNLYLLEAPVNSGYDLETEKPDKDVSYMLLIPLDYHKKSIGKGVSTNNITKMSWTTYRRNNPDVFWKAP